MMGLGGHRGLVSAAGDPLPPSAVAERVKQYDPSLRIILVHGQPPYWAVCQELKPGDPRKDSEFPYSMICPIPADCSVDMAAAYVENHLRRALGPKEVKEAADAIIKDVEQSTATGIAAAKADVRTELVEEAERMDKRDFDLMAGIAQAHAMVTVG